MFLVCDGTVSSVTCMFSSITDCLHGVSDLFRVQVWTTDDPGRFTVRVEAWRKKSSGDNRRNVGTDEGPSFDVQYEAVRDPKGALHTVRYMIETMLCPGTSPAILFLDLSGLTRDIPRPIWEDLKSLAGRVHVPDHPIHRAILNGDLDDLPQIRERLSNRDGNCDGGDDPSRYYTEQEIKALRDMSNLRDCMPVGF